MWKYLFPPATIASWMVLYTCVKMYQTYSSPRWLFFFMWFYNHKKSDIQNIGFWPILISSAFGNAMSYELLSFLDPESRACQWINQKLTSSGCWVISHVCAESSQKSIHSVTCFNGTATSQFSLPALSLCMDNHLLHPYCLPHARIEQIWMISLHLISVGASVQQCIVVPLHKCCSTQGHMNSQCKHFLVLPHAGGQQPHRFCSFPSTLVHLSLLYCTASLLFSMALQLAK